MKKRAGLLKLLVLSVCLLVAIGLASPAGAYLDCTHDMYIGGGGCWSQSTWQVYDESGNHIGWIMGPREDCG